MKDVTIKNINLFGTLSYYFNANISMTNVTYSNNCFKDIECKTIGEIIEFPGINDNISTVNISNSTFENLNGAYGITVFNNVKYNINNITVTNCNYEYGVFLVMYETNSSVTVNNSNFKNNTAYEGTIFYIYSVRPNYDNDITINNSLFENNYAENFGGVIYVPNELLISNDISKIEFNDCEFKNNTAKKGNISFSYSKIDGPYFSNIDELIKEGAIVTNPTHIGLLPDSEKSINVLSGETLLNGIK
ncbi:hypothetical protein BCR36DRAFT_156476 [Piromyces finnis]|uniref:Right handed beta helix domain-containing protein n=1 Tax=Piromyces finnis TaxID=1754191 RepID=A0A1Y1UWT4_9FUNG|nr:hypothetical protein BCR36DRAFT_156476 [Piromyces finnis]|eukprot:ORX42622.1 hypothetical protein BCR36DRAFT_156476 [Piromyces finnis]